MPTFFSSIRSLIWVASLVLGLTIMVGVSVANAQSDAYLTEVKNEVTWLNLDAVFGTQPVGNPQTGGRPYLALARREFTTCPGESLARCVRVPREKNAQNLIATFWAKNPTDCRQDGYSLNPQTGLMQTGIPANFEGLMEGFTIRPCTPGATYGVASGTGFALSASVAPSSMLSETMDLTQTASITDTTFVTYNAVVTTARLRVRSTPKAVDTSNVTGFVYQDNVVTVVAHSADGLWANVGTDQWVAREFLKVTRREIRVNGLKRKKTAVSPSVMINSHQERNPCQRSETYRSMPLASR